MTIVERHGIHAVIYKEAKTDNKREVSTPMHPLIVSHRTAPPSLTPTPMKISGSTIVPIVIIVSTIPAVLKLINLFFPFIIRR